MPCPSSIRGGEKVIPVLVEFPSGCELSWATRIPRKINPYPRVAKPHGVQRSERISHTVFYAFMTTLQRDCQIPDGDP